MSFVESICDPSLWPLSAAQKRLGSEPITSRINDESFFVECHATIDANPLKTRTPPAVSGKERKKLKRSMSGVVKVSWPCPSLLELDRHQRTWFGFHPGVMWSNDAGGKSVDGWRGRFTIGWVAST
jgi:hypothetical protein